MRLFYALPDMPTADTIRSMRLILYQRDDCPLCDHALAILAAARAPDFDSVWIDEVPDLEALYGERVPVLRDLDSQREIGWPFDAEVLRHWLAEDDASSGARA